MNRRTFVVFFVYSYEVQQTGLNFIYDMQNCSSTQLNMNLSKKILKLLQVSVDHLLTNEDISLLALGRLSCNVKKYLHYLATQMVQSSL